jgi:hypothetical protein
MSDTLSISGTTSHGRPFSVTPAEDQLRLVEHTTVDSAPAGSEPSSRGETESAPGALPVSLSKTSKELST